ncbi:hypothetical protein TBLA_0A07000 [Henningerozyma blattae CBS 6284]|uniref:Uncharacterized protein n=1 Tax=Henningerozyma blattae (strain ATCC 34711 / CBS 6284 / DSM 70876 / NBRC 10599 / NRRL Y-10934 / UCD 77-7) TaxID=1071380 RepID=I2GWI9_HENB6|nr:hypothetical protein TBLA_0A07000 [Tetrapisispora blattae CBS 6284]CCH58491.1 hypothetical protein TBLA_0A07000 [Tetrapisispora blattae CBS 6284]
MKQMSLEEFLENDTLGESVWNEDDINIDAINENPLNNTISNKPKIEKSVENEISTKKEPIRPTKTVQPPPHDTSKDEPIIIEGPPYMIKFSNLPPKFSDFDIEDLFNAKQTRLVKYKLYWELEKYPSISILKNGSIFDQNFKRTAKVSFVEVMNLHDADKILRFWKIPLLELYKIKVEPAEFTDFQNYLKKQQILTDLISKDPRDNPSKSYIPPKPKPNPFGSAKPVDTQSKMLDIENKISNFHVEDTAVLRKLSEGSLAIGKETPNQTNPHPKEKIKVLKRDQKLSSINVNDKTNNNTTTSTQQKTNKTELNTTTSPKLQNENLTLSPQTPRMVSYSQVARRADDAKKTPSASPMTTPNNQYINLTHTNSNNANNSFDRSLLLKSPIIHDNINEEIDDINDINITDNNNNISKENGNNYSHTRSPIRYSNPNANNNGHYDRYSNNSYGNNHSHNSYNNTNNYRGGYKSYNNTSRGGSNYNHRPYRSKYNSISGTNNNYKQHGGRSSYKKSEYGGNGSDDIENQTETQQTDEQSLLFKPVSTFLHDNKRSYHNNSNHHGSNRGGYRSKYNNNSTSNYRGNYHTSSRTTHFSQE